MGPTWSQHSCYSSPCFVVPQCFAIPPILLLLFLVSYSFSCFATPLRVLPLLLFHSTSYFIAPPTTSPLLLLCYSFSCFATPLASLLLFVFHHSSYFVVPHLALLLLSMLHGSFYYFATPPTSLLLRLLHCSSMLHHSSCFAIPPFASPPLFLLHLVVIHGVWLLLRASLPCCSLCFIATHCASLLPIVFCCCSCFGVASCLVVALALLFLLFCYCMVCHRSSMFCCSPTFPNTCLPLVTSLLLHASMLLSVLLLFCTNWYSAPPLAPPFARCWKFAFGIDWEEARKHPSPELLVSFFCFFFFLEFFFWFPFFDFNLGFYFTFFFHYFTWF